MSKTFFILSYTIFVFFLIQILALMGQNIINNAPNPPIIPPQPTILDYIVYPFLNIGYFFQLMAISSTYALIGLILLPFNIALIWSVIELIRGV